MGVDRQRILDELHEIGQTVMPFGRFAGTPLYRLPAEYLHYFTIKGWPKGRLGELMQKVYQMKVDGSDVAFDLFRGPSKTVRKADR